MFTTTLEKVLFDMLNSSLHNSTILDNMICQYLLMPLPIRYNHDKLILLLKQQRLVIDYMVPMQSFIQFKTFIEKIRLS